MEPGSGAPSQRAAERLRAGVSRDVADLRLQLEEASLRSDALLWAGYPAQAAEVVDEKRELVSRFEARLRQRLSEAAVEAEAERVLAAASADLPRSSASAERSAGRSSPALLSALAAALLAVVAVGGTATDMGELSSSDRTDPSNGGHEIAALPEHVDGGSVPADLQRSPVAPEPAPTRDRAVPRHAAADLPQASPTERLVGMLQGLVGAADAVVRDALRTLLAEAEEPVVRTERDAPRSTPSEEPSSAPEDEATDDTAEPSDQGTEEDGLSSVTPPLDMEDGTGEADDEAGTGDETPPER